LIVIRQATPPLKTIRACKAGLSGRECAIAGFLVSIGELIQINVRRITQAKIFGGRHDHQREQEKTYG
jgi:hypothetical protein